MSNDNDKARILTRGHSRKKKTERGVRVLNFGDVGGYSLDIRPVCPFNSFQRMYFDSEAQLREVYEELDRYFSNPKNYESNEL